MSGFLIPPKLRKWLIRSVWVGGCLLAVGCLAFLIAVGRMLYLFGSMGR